MSAPRAKSFCLPGSPVISGTSPTAIQLPDNETELKKIIDLSFGVDTNTGVFDVTGHPAISVPCGSTDGLPIGMMLIGRYGEEETLLRAAHAFETLTHGLFTKPAELK